MFCLHCWFVTKHKINDFHGDITSRGWMVLILKIGDRVIGEIRSYGDKVRIGTMHSVNPPYSSNSAGAQLIQNWWNCEGVGWKFLLEKGGRGFVQKWVVAILYGGFYRDSSWYSIEKNLDVFIFLLLTNMCYKTNAPPKIWDNCH